MDGKTLSRCSQTNKVLDKNLEEYRLYLVKKVQKCLKNQSSQSTCNPTRILDFPWTANSAIKSNITFEQLTFEFLVQFLRYFCDYKLKVHEVNFRIISIKKTAVLFGIFIKNKTNGCLEDVMVVSQKKKCQYFRGLKYLLDNLKLTLLFVHFFLDFFSVLCP